MDKKEDGKVVGLISSEELYRQAALFESFRDDAVRIDMAKHILANNPDITKEFRLILENAVSDSFKAVTSSPEEK